MQTSLHWFQTGSNVSMCVCLHFSHFWDKLTFFFFITDPKTEAFSLFHQTETSESLCKKFENRERNQISLLAPTQALSSTEECKTQAGDVCSWIRLKPWFCSVWGLLTDHCSVLRRCLEQKASYWPSSFTSIHIMGWPSLTGLRRAESCSSGETPHRFWFCRCWLTLADGLLNIEISSAYDEIQTIIPVCLHTKKTQIHVLLKPKSKQYSEYATIRPF